MIKRTGFLFVLLLAAIASASSQDDASRLLNRLDGILSTAEERLSSTQADSDSESLSFFIINNTGFTIRRIFVFRADDDDWGDNVLNHPLHNGQNVSISPGFPLDGVTLYNIRLIDVDGDFFTRYNITLRPRSRIRMGISDFEF